MKTKHFFPLKIIFDFFSLTYVNLAKTKGNFEVLKKVIHLWGLNSKSGNFISSAIVKRKQKMSHRILASGNT